MSDTCPKCGAVRTRGPMRERTPYFACHSEDIEGGLLQSSPCRIRELEAELTRLSSLNESLAAQLKPFEDIVGQIDVTKLTPAPWEAGLNIPACANNDPRSNILWHGREEISVIYSQWKSDETNCVNAAFIAAARNAFAQLIAARELLTQRAERP